MKNIARLGGFFVVVKTVYYMTTGNRRGKAGKKENNSQKLIRHFSSLIFFSHFSSLPFGIHIHVSYFSSPSSLFCGTRTFFLLVFSGFVCSCSHTHCNILYDFHPHFRVKIESKLYTQSFSVCVCVCKKFNSEYTQM